MPVPRTNLKPPATLERGVQLSRRHSAGDGPRRSPTFLFEHRNGIGDRLTRVDQIGQSGGNSVAEKRVDLAYNAISQFTSLARYKDTDGGGSARWVPCHFLARQHDGCHAGLLKSRPCGQLALIRFLFRAALRLLLLPRRDFPGRPHIFSCAPAAPNGAPEWLQTNLPLPSLPLFAAGLPRPR